MTINVYYDSRQASKPQRSRPKSWAVTLFKGGRSETYRFETQAEADTFAEKHST